jgi:hypothetical protein
VGAAFGIAVVFTLGVFAQRSGLIDAGLDQVRKFWNRLRGNK